MALLKSLIQRLLDSRTTPAQAGHASKPGSAVVDYNPSASVDNWGPLLSNSTAVSDGYIWATGHTTSDKGFFQIKTQALQITTTGTSNPGGEILNLFTPVSKGQLFSVYGRYLEQVTVRLVKLSGGGYNRIVRRAVLCLKPSFNYLPRSFCKANPNGLHPKAFQKGGYSCHLSLLNMSLLTMDTLAFTKALQTQENLLMFMPLTQLIQSLQGFAWALLRGLLHTQKLFLLEKAARSLSLTRQIQSKNYGFRRLSAAINNLEVGGALC